MIRCYLEKKIISTSIALLSLHHFTYTHNPGLNMSVDLTKLEAHLSTRSYVEG